MWRPRPLTRENIIAAATDLITESYYTNTMVQMDNEAIQRASSKRSKRLEREELEAEAKAEAKAAARAAGHKRSRTDKRVPEPAAKRARPEGAEGKEEARATTGDGADKSDVTA